MAAPSWAYGPGLQGVGGAEAAKGPALDWPLEKKDSGDGKKKANVKGGGKD